MVQPISCGQIAPTVAQIFRLWHQEGHFALVNLDFWTLEAKAFSKPPLRCFYRFLQAEKAGFRTFVGFSQQIFPVSELLAEFPDSFSR